MANTIPGAAVGLSCSTPKLSQRPTSRFLQSYRRFCTVKMAVSLDEKKSFTLEKSEQAFNAAKVQLPFYPICALL
ncbi:glutamate-1-semialdehyde 2,1-aminomutase 2 [Pyrus ussuriensis x Pyrus communis]|uniref:Glutamate-1-semialdehyde 2,1-aminomutase 2 n=1 Tax=Pyrus ussuriensis x Pyrus communis TaxID=2448454 RepID=A0A5N5HYW9_9ROSA|nr:glutamate-1-semialdehyde 2,1-aminomutase 2 [Pyrus ussuriensis x Pyrus communis]